MILDRISEHAAYEGLHPLFREAFAFLSTVADLAPGRYEISGGMYALVNPEGVTKALSDIPFEAHRKFIDLQYVLRGPSVLTWAPLSDLTPAGEYDGEKDLLFLSGEGSTIELHTGDFFIAYPHDGHKPNGHFTSPNPYRVIVVKIPVEA